MKKSKKNMVRITKKNDSAQCVFSVVASFLDVGFFSQVDKKTYDNANNCNNDYDDPRNLHCWCLW